MKALNFILTVLALTSFLYAQGQCVATDQIHSNQFGNSGFGGIMFDITAINSVQIECFETYFTPGPLTEVDFEIWYKDGSYSGSQTDSTDWTFIGRTMGFMPPPTAGVIAEIPIDVDVTILAGQTAAFYITNGDTVLGNGQGVRYETNGSNGAVTNSDMNIEIKDGKGSSLLFQVVSGFRKFAGRVNYSTGSVGINDQAGPEIALYPNPVNDQLRIRTDLPNATFQVVDLTGRLVFEGTLGPDGSSDLTVEAFENGVYTIQLQSGTAQLVRTFVKG